MIERGKGRKERKDMKKVGRYQKTENKLTNKQTKQ